MDADGVDVGPGGDAVAGPPTARAYRHRRCGGCTQIGGREFVRLSNPFAVVRETICCGCDRAVPIRDVEWADTGESVAAYRKRLRSETPLGLRVSFGLLGPVAGALIGFACGFIGGLLMIGPLGNRPWWRQESGLIAGGIAACYGLILGAQLLPGPLMRRLWGRDYRGVP